MTHIPQIGGQSLGMAAGGQAAGGYGVAGAYGGATKKRAGACLMRWMWLQMQSGYLNSLPHPHWPTVPFLSPHIGYDEAAYGVQPQGPKAEAKDATGGYQAGGGYQAPHLRG